MRARAIVGPALALLAAFALAASTAFPARASCGAENCPLDLHVRHAGSALSFGLDWEYVPQDRVRVGLDRGSVGQLASPENEVRTTSRVGTASVHLEPIDRWRFDLRLPFVQRTHVHDALAAGGRTRQRWDYAGLGDALLMAGWRATPDRARTELWIQGGVKAPTGARNVPEVDGEQPEPAARPGTGSWDGVAGLHAMRPMRWAPIGGGTAGGSLFASVQGRLNGRGTDDYVLGRELLVNAGGTRPLAGPVSLLAQLNLRLRGHDSPGRTDALAANTGGSWLFLSPGLSVGRQGASAFAYIQVPVYQKVNRIQIVAPWMFYSGITWAWGDTPPQGPQQKTE